MVIVSAVRIKNHITKFKTSIQLAQDQITFGRSCRNAHNYMNGGDNARLNYIREVVMHSCCIHHNNWTICHHPNPSTAFQRKYFTDQLTEENDVHYHDEGVKGIHPILHMHATPYQHSG